MSNQKYILITGTSSGLGHALVHECISRGFTVFAGIRKGSDKMLFSHLQNVIPLILDVTDAESRACALQFMSTILKNEGLYALINNAGVHFINAFEETDGSQERQLMEVNLFGVMQMSRMMLPFLHQFVKTHDERAKIINIGSLGSIFALPWSSAYHASKFALMGFSQSLAYELKPLNIAVCCFNPGGIKTDIFQKSVIESKQTIQNQNSPHALYYENNLKNLYQVMQRYENTRAMPQKVAKAVVNLLESNSLPFQKYFGIDAQFIRVLKLLGLIGLMITQFIVKKN